MSRVPDAKGLMAHHLQDEELLAHLDGELTQIEKSKVISHLESCWDCRTRLNDLQKNIHQFIEIRKTLPVPNAYGTAQMRVEQFRSRLMRHAEQRRASQGGWAKVRSALGPPLTASLDWVSRHRQPALALLVAFCLVLAMFTDVWTSRLSAETILLKAQGFETANEPMSGSVLKSTVRMERITSSTNHRDELGSVTTFRQSAAGPVLIKEDASSSSSQAVVNLSNLQSGFLKQLIIRPGISEPVAQFLAAVQWMPDLNPGELRKILDARGSSSDSVLKANGIWELHFPFASGHVSTISEAIYAVNARSFAPQHLSLFTSENGQTVEYRFTQAEFEIQSRTNELATLLNPNVRPSRTEAGNSNVPAARIFPLTYANSLATEAEISLASALHRTDVCLGDEIYIFPMSDGSLLLQGLVDSSQRRDVVRKAAKSVPGPLSIEIYLPRELKRSTQLLPPPDSLGAHESESQAATVTTLADLSDQRVPLHDVLYRHFSAQGLSAFETEQQVNAFSNEVVTLARQTFLHAWALKRLEREFSKARTAKLPQDALSAVDKLRADHRRWIETLSHRQAQALGTIVESGPTKGLSDSPLPDADTLLQLAREQNDLVRALFTTSNRQAQPSVDVARLLAVLKKMGA